MFPLRDPFYHPVRNAVLGLSQPVFDVPNLELLARLSESDGRAEARTHRVVSELLAAPRGPVTREEATDAILALTAPHRDMKAEDHAAALEMNLKALAFFQDLDKFLAGREQGRRAALEQQHAETYKKCRELSDLVVSLQRSYGYQANIARGLVGKSANLESDRDSVANGRPTKYPSASEFAEWQGRLDAAQTALGAAQKDCAQAQSGIDQTEHEIKLAQQELAKFEAEEKKLIEQLRGME